MAIRKTDIQKYSSQILELLEREKIKSLRDLQNRLGDSFLTPEGQIFLDAIPFSTLTVHILKYVIPSRVTPIEVRLNPTYGHSDIIIKSGEEITDYHPTYSEFSSDLSGNIVQDKRIDLSSNRDSNGDLSFDRLVEELRKLSKIK